MKIIVISASPKGKNSITLQSVRYLEKHIPQAEFRVFHVGQKIKAIEKKPALFQEIIDTVKESDCVLWCYPVYTCLVPYQLVKFIDLIFERHQQAAFAGKYAVQISTSLHFFDHNAYNYMHHTSEDLGMKHLPGHCADMNDLTIEPGRTRLRAFAAELYGSISSAAPVSRKYIPVEANIRDFTPPANLPKPPKAKDHDLVLVTDCADPNSNLGRMIKTYQRLLPHKLTIVNIGEFDFQGGCLGCFKCALDGQCVYKDGFGDFHRETIASADGIIIAASINRHWFNPVWKCYDDRQFYNGHRTVAMGKAIGYIISGPLRQEANLREVLEARCQVGHFYMLDIVTDEYDTDSEITALLDNLAQKTMWALENRPQRPINFFGVGGMKIFRDLIYVMRGLMKEDHRFYKEHGLYDFPQKEVKRILLMQFVGLLLKSKGARKKAEHRIQDIMLKPYHDAIERY